MNLQQTTATRRYPRDLDEMQAIVRRIMLADPWYADPWEPPYGGMISARVGVFASPLEISWKQEDGGTDLTAKILAPLTARGRGDFFGIRRRALDRFWADVERAIAQSVPPDQDLLP